MSVEDLLNKQFHTVGNTPCWVFCQRVLSEMNLPVPMSLDKMERIDSPRIGTVVLFRQSKGGFHCGVVYPTTVHFVHCRVPLAQPTHPPVGRKDRLSDPLYKDIIDGYYGYRGQP